MKKLNKSIKFNEELYKRLLEIKGYNTSLFYTNWKLLKTTK